MSQPLIAPFPAAATWLAVASGEARLVLRDDDGALEMNFDFADGKGFVVARREVDLTLPESFVIRFDIQGEAPVNNLEFKFEDKTRRNVWRWEHKDFAAGSGARTIQLRRRDFTFAWGPQGGGGVREVGAIEIAIVAGTGGKGSVRIGGITIEQRLVSSTPKATASTGIVQGARWTSRCGDTSPWWQCDFGGERDAGGLAIHWGEHHAGTGFIVEHSLDGCTWRSAWRADASFGRTSWVHLPDCIATLVRLRFDPLPEDAAIQLERVEFLPFDAGRSVDEFIHTIALASPRGLFPRCWIREQSYWTPVAAPRSGPVALMNEEGMIECANAAFSLEPMLVLDGKLTTWADAEIHVSLHQDWMPAPSAKWSAGKNTSLLIAACVTSDATLHVRYELSGAPPGSKLLLLARPFQVTPPWQRFGRFGGVGDIHALHLSPVALLVNDVFLLTFDKPCAACASLPIESGIAVDLLPDMPASTHDRGSMITALMQWDADKNGSLNIALSSGVMPCAEALAGAGCSWAGAFADWHITGSESVQRIVNTWRTALAHVLSNRHGPFLQPGPRRYTRCWIRDAAGMAAALLRAGDHETTAALLRAYAPHQRADGLIPCCIDDHGPDWLIEYDSLGEFIFAVHEHARFANDDELRREMLPHVRRAVECITQLRATRLTDEYRSPDKAARFGLLPESASHEGYLAQPVHSYWDDFYALRGLRDAAALLRDAASAESTQVLALADAFEQTLAASLRMVVEQRELDYLPGSVEWADFDPTATSIALVLLDAVPGVPESIVHATYDKYLSGMRERAAGRTDWKNYSAYEVRIAAALIRLDRRDDALEVLDHLLDDMRPQSWHQFPEITWRDPRSPGHIGDVPHTWIAAEYALAARSLFVYERDADHSLVLCAGVPLPWLAGEGLNVSGLPTPHGRLSFSFRQTSTQQLVLSLAALHAIPAGGLRILPPAPLAGCTVNGTPCAIDDIVVRETPALVVMNLETARA